VRTRPFLSHRRADRHAVIALKHVLAMYGVGGWRDIDDLHLRSSAEVRHTSVLNSAC